MPPAARDTAHPTRATSIRVTTLRFPYDPEGNNIEAVIHD